MSYIIYNNIIIYHNTPFELQFVYDFGRLKTLSKNYKMIWKAVLVAILAVGVLAELKVTDEQRQRVRQVVSNICKKNGAEDKADEVVDKIKNFVDCAMGLFDYNTMRQEIEDAKPKGVLDEVFKKYCEKTPQLKTCIHNLSSGVAPCLDSSLSQEIAAANNATDQLLDFICYKDGYRVALFIAESGPECFKTKATGIEACTVGIKNLVTNIDEAKKLSLNEQCGKLDELTACVVRTLEECESPTPGNMAESLFKYIRQQSLCKNIKAKE